MQAALDGLQGDRLHHRLHDPLPGRGLHPGALHGRHPGPAAARVCRDHRRGHSDLRLCLAEPDPHAVQPVSAAPGARESTTGGCTCCLERFFDGMLRVYAGAPRKAWTLRHGGRHGRFLLDSWPPTPTCSSSVPKDFIPAQDTGRIFGFTEAAQGISFPAWSGTSRPWPTIVRGPRGPGLHVFGGRRRRRHVASNAGRMFLRLKPRGQRRSSRRELIQRLRARLAAVPGHQCLSAEPAGDPHRRPASPRASISITLQGPDIE